MRNLKQRTRPHSWYVPKDGFECKFVGSKPMLFTDIYYFTTLEVERKVSK
jgi:hypothetical protein